LLLLVFGIMAGCGILPAMAAADTAENYYYYCELLFYLDYTWGVYFKSNLLEGDGILGVGGECTRNYFLPSIPALLFRLLSIFLELSLKESTRWRRFRLDGSAGIIVGLELTSSVGTTYGLAILPLASWFGLILLSLLDGLLLLLLG